MTTTYPLYRAFSRADEPFPTQAEVVIAGAGIMGCAAAYYLARRGIRAVVFDKSRVAGQQSTRAWGFVRQQGREAAEVPLMMAGMRIWEGLEAELGADLEWRQGGCLYLADQDEDWAAFQDWLGVAREHGLDTRALAPAEVGRHVTGLAAPVLGGLYTASDGQAEPRRVAPAFAARAIERGARFFDGCGVSAIETAGGAVTGVVTERGLVKTSRVICAAGAASFRLLDGVGIRLPQQTVRGTCIRTNALPAVSAATLWGHGLGIRQRADGAINLADDMSVDVDLTLGHLRGLSLFMPELWKHRRKFRLHLNGALLGDLARRIGGGPGAIEPREPQPRPNPAQGPRALARLRRIFPALAAAQAVESWAGLIDVLPDGIPVIDAPDAVRGLAIATGFCGHGFAMGPIVGRLLAELVDGGAPSLELGAFRARRFVDGTMQRPRSML
ncbi:NAD(P)/FAD-dependent oxidoreductase [Burkholderia glumae]|uniref:NAD(P)/FAD-dependent oxidoreductase n=1 Tax=Burkholderia glumae TaxID=337 RepID=UPI001463F5B0|nr:FAD-binding oxidoreductase [Burkholderia glumae]MCM2495399.1 FAD-binding oxidoreductase [Burkholderia glumae]MCM2546401.1 FAD-binding oxidoreductase [Burkholderia glumae]QJP70446.1 FAD-binding oxidoreductase [Burkholderia glumae]UVS98894.1 FAD-binding oxidoreductase [Burkholderia glumae]